MGCGSCHGGLGFGQRDPSKMRPLSAGEPVGSGLVRLADRRRDLGFGFVSGRRGLPDDLKPPVVAGLNAVVDRRRGALGDHFLGGTFGIAAVAEIRSGGVHQFSH